MEHNSHQVIADLEHRRNSLKKALIETTHMRPGTLSSSYRRCGKPTCKCAGDDSKKHGPVYRLTWKDEDQKTVGQMIPEAFLESTREQVEEYHRFRKLVKELITVEGEICRLMIHRPGSLEETGKKKPRRPSSK